MRSLQIAATGMQAQQTNVEVISNNIANISTTGYKRRRAEFQDLLYQNLRRPGTQPSDTGTLLPSGAQLCLGVRTAAISRIRQQGKRHQTDKRFELAIRAKGYFERLWASGGGWAGPHSCTPCPRAEPCSLHSSPTISPSLPLFSSFLFLFSSFSFFSSPLLLLPFFFSFFFFSSFLFYTSPSPRARHQPLASCP